MAYSLEMINDRGNRQYLAIKGEKNRTFGTVLVRENDRRSGKLFDVYIGDDFLLDSVTLKAIHELTVSEAQVLANTLSVGVLHAMQGDSPEVTSQIYNEELFEALSILPTKNE